MTDEVTYRCTACGQTVAVVHEGPLHLQDDMVLICPRCQGVTLLVLRPLRRQESSPAG